MRDCLDNGEEESKMREKETKARILGEKL